MGIDGGRLPTCQRPGRGESHDDVDLEVHQLSRERREPLKFPLEVPEIAKPLPECLDQTCLKCGRRVPKIADARHPARPLRLRDERRDERTRQRAQHEAAPVHHSST